MFPFDVRTRRGVAIRFVPLEVCAWCTSRPRPLGSPARLPAGAPYRSPGSRPRDHSVPTTIGLFDRRSGLAHRLVHSQSTDHPDRSRREESLRPTSGHGVRRRALRPPPPGTTTAFSGWTASGAASRRGRPDSQCTNCAVKVLIAAITVTTIRDGRPSIAGACREWTKLAAAVDRPRERTSPNRKRAVPAADRRGPQRGSRVGVPRLAAADAVQPRHATIGCATSRAQEAAGNSFGHSVGIDE